jgi:hypothetical protein
LPVFSTTGEHTVAELKDNTRGLHESCTQRFIELANEMQQERIGQELISAALMTASGIYTTYTIAGNTGGLNPSGVDKVVQTYRSNLEHIQARKREEFGQPAP